MESLSNALQRITPWYLDTEQEVPRNAPQGLSPEDLRDLLEYLPFKLPEEVWQLYQWCDGGYQPMTENRMEQYRDVYRFNINNMVGASIIPLKDAIDLWFEYNDEEEITSSWYQFPIFGHERGLTLVQGSDEIEYSSPVWDADWLDCKLGKPAFPDIASMMSGVADSLEAKQSFLDDSGYFDEQGYWDVYDSIWEKYRMQ